MGITGINPDPLIRGDGMWSDLFGKVIVFKQKAKASNHNPVWLYLSTRNQNPARVHVRVHLR